MAVGGGSSSTPSTTTQISQVQLPGWLEDRYQQAASGAARWYDDWAVPHVSGLPFNAAPVDDTWASIGMTRDLATGGAQDQIGQALGAYGNTLGGAYLDPRTDWRDYFDQTQEGAYLNAATPQGSFWQGQLAGAPGMVDQDFERELLKTAQGKYLLGGKGYDEAIGAATKYTLPALQGQFARAGRSGSGLAQEAVASAISDAFARQYGTERDRQQAAMMGLGQFFNADRNAQLASAQGLAGQYGMERGLQQGAAGQLAGFFDSERGRQMAAMGLAPQMNALQYDPAQRLAAIGDFRTANNQGALDEQRFREEYAHNRPFLSLDQYIQRLQGVAPYAGGTTTETKMSPTYTNTGANALGGALTGAALGNALAPQLGGAALGLGLSSTPWLLPFGGIGAGLGLLSGIMGG